MKLLSPRAHGFLDYAIVLAFAAAPTFFRASELAGPPAWLCYALAGGQGALSLFTRYPLGIGKVIPFPTHGAVEVVISLLLIAAPWVFGFVGAYAGRNMFVFFGASLAGVWAITDYRAAEAPGAPRSVLDENRASLGSR